MVVVGLFLSGALYALADPEFVTRQQTTTNYEDDGSARYRIRAWRGSLELVRDHPLGTGGQGFWELSPIYVPNADGATGAKRDPHNTFVLVASEWGIAGLALFVSYYFFSFRLLREVRRHALSGIWYYRSVAIQLGMIGMLVAGSFTDRFYSEAPYWMGALAVALHRIHAHKLRTETAAEAEAGDRPEVVMEPAFPLTRAV
jgi:O-antigen ligase